MPTGSHSDYTGQFNPNLPLAAAPRRRADAEIRRADAEITSGEVSTRALFKMRVHSPDAGAASINSASLAPPFYF